LNKLLEDGNALYRRDKISDSVYRYEYALKKLPPASSLSEEGDDVRQRKRNAKLSELYAKLHSHLLLNLSQALRAAGDASAAAEKADAAVHVAMETPNGACLAASEALWSRSRARLQMAEEGIDAVTNASAALADAREALKLSPDNLNLHKFTAKVMSYLAKLQQSKASSSSEGSGSSPRTPRRGEAEGKEEAEKKSIGDLSLLTKELIPQQECV